MSGHNKAWTAACRDRVRSTNRCPRGQGELDESAAGTTSSMDCGAAGVRTRRQWRWWGDAPLGGLAQAVPQMPPVRDLDRLRRSCCGALGEERRAVPADHLDAGPLCEPRGQARCFPVREEVDRTAGSHAHQDSAVAAALAVAYSSTPPTRGAATSGSGSASARRRTVLRLTNTPRRAARRAPVRPAKARPTAARLARSRSMRWPYLRVRPDIYSKGVRHHPQPMPFNQPSPRCWSRTRRSSACRGPAPPR